MINDEWMRIANAAVSSYSNKAQSGESAVYVSNIDTSPSNEPVSLVEDGVSVFIGQNRAASSTPKTRNVISLTPEATILLKKKAFSTLGSNNDLRWMDKSEKVLLRATKALFSHKASQIRAYEALTKLDDFYEKTNQINLAFYADFLYQMQYLNMPKEAMDSELDLLKGDFISKYGAASSWTSDIRVSYQNELDCLSNGACSGVEPSHALELILSSTRKALSGINISNVSEYVIDDLMSLMKRNAFAGDHHLTTWIIDPSDPNNDVIGPGTGVIEITSFSNFSTTCQSKGSPSSASFSIEDPYRMTIVLDDDIEKAIQGALAGNVSSLNTMTSGVGEPIDGSMIASSAFELLGLGSLDSTIDVDYVRDRLRTFYLGKSFINPADGVHFFIRGNRSTHDNSNGGTGFSSSSPIVDDEHAIDDTVLEAERRLYTNENIDLETYRAVRDTRSLSMVHVFGGFVTNVSSQYRSGGKHTISVSCKDNLEWLNWSRIMTTPALQDPQGILEDPLTPFELSTDELGKIDGSGAPELLYENKYLLQSGLLSFDSGILNGQVANENNLYQGQYNNGGSLHGAKVVQHPSGLIYRWKTGIVTATAGLTSTDQKYGSYVSASKHTREYGLQVAESVFNNLDVANILSMLIVGQPYNVETFMKQALTAGGITNSSSQGNLSPLDPIYAVLNAARSQNSRFGNFKPYRMITMSNQTWQQSTNDQVGRTRINSNIESLQRRKAYLLTKIRKVRISFGLGESGSTPVVAGMEREILTIDAGIRAQLSAIKDSSKVDGYDLLSATFNLFGTNRVLPLSGDFEADAQVTRSMTIVGAQRRIEDVRLNRDTNLFIVSDQYDNNVDIKPYIFALNESGWSLFKGKYESSYEKCSLAAKFLNLEFFCNPNGHIELRPPMWNKTPLSVLKKLIEIKHREGRNIVPNFLEDMFDTRVSSIKKDVHTSNIKIALISLLLGFYPDSRLIPGMTTKGRKSLEFFGISSSEGDGGILLGLGTEKDNLFGTDILGGDPSETGGILGGSFSLNWTDASDGDILVGDTETLIGEFDPITQEAFGSGLVNEVFPSAPPAPVSDTAPPMIAKGSSDEAKKAAKIGIVNKIRDDYRRSYGSDPLYDIARSGDISANHFAFKPMDDTEGSFKEDSSRTFSLLKKLQIAVSKRDSLVTILKRNLAKQEELEEVERILTSGNKSQFDDVQGDFSPADSIGIQRIFSQDGDPYVWVETRDKVSGLKDGDYIRIDGTSGSSAQIINGTHYAKFVTSSGSFTGGWSAFALSLTSGRSILDESGFKDTKVSKAIEELSFNNATVTKSSSPIGGRVVGALKGVYDALSSTIDIFTGDATKGSIFDHLIEDDSRNLTGPGSGRRFTIRDHELISATLREDPPEFTRVNVTGDAPIIGKALDGAFEGTAFWAGGTDFDLWRQYGYKPKDTRLPFAHDAEMQCRPYVVLSLQMQRAAINKGNITVAGNEYYQPGDTIYLEYKGMLYYVVSVQHSFSIGGSFTTTLTLEFGHVPGEYLPSPLDVIGQQYVGNPLYENFLVYRSDQGDDSYRPLQPDCAIVFPPRHNISEENIEDLLDYRKNMARFYNMMIDLSNIIVGDRKILLRGFYTDNKDKADAEERVGIIKSMLLNPVMLKQYQATSEGDDILDMVTSLGGLTANNSTKGTQPMKLPNGLYAEQMSEDDIIIQIVNMSNKEGVTSEVSAGTAGCMSKEVDYALSGNGAVSLEDDGTGLQDDLNKSIFPSSGPKQGSWLEFRDSVSGGDAASISRIVEVGVIELQ
jgi:hypothetical protein